MSPRGSHRRSPPPGTGSMDRVEIGPPVGSQLVGRTLRDSDGTRWRVLRVDLKTGRAYLHPRGIPVSLETMRVEPLSSLESRIRVAWEMAHRRKRGPTDEDRWRRAHRTGTSSRRVERSD